ncbi:uncharacterized protein [Procambarus clarkii]|uniref:uncharacterized protein n=1 Tax=Procambarus clarkii TaxID=6728 RepID=UPI00374267CB
MLVDSNTETMMASPSGSVSSSASGGEDNKSRLFSCTTCTYRTDRKNNLKRHIFTMHEISSALLECCGHRFLNKAELRMHTQKCHRDGYHCGVCPRVFCRKALLKRHYSVHSGYREFSCSHCSYATSHKSNLERHMKVHTKDPEPLARHLLEGFLPELPQHNTHFPLTLPVHNTVLPAQHLQLYANQVNPPFYHPARVPQAPWPVLPPSHTPLHNHQAPYLPHYTPPHVLTPDSDLHSLKPSKPLVKKTGPSKSFTVSALLGEDVDRKDEVWSQASSVQPTSHAHYGASTSSEPVATDGVLSNGASHRTHTPTAPATLTPTAPATLTPTAPTTLTPPAPTPTTSLAFLLNSTSIASPEVHSARDVQASIPTFTSSLWGAPGLTFPHNYLDPYHGVYSFPPVHRTHWIPGSVPAQDTTASSIPTLLPHPKDHPYCSGSSGYGSHDEHSPRPVIEDQPQVEEHKEDLRQSHTDDHMNDFGISRTDDHKWELKQPHIDDKDLRQPHTDDHKRDFSKSHTDEIKGDFSKPHTDEIKGDFSKPHTDDHQDYIPKKLRASKKFQVMQKCPE